LAVILILITLIKLLVSTLSSLHGILII